MLAAEIPLNCFLLRGGDLPLYFLILFGDETDLLPFSHIELTHLSVTPFYDNMPAGQLVDNIIIFSEPVLINCLNLMLICQCQETSPSSLSISVVLMM